MRVNPQETFTENNETGDVLDSIWGKIVQLDSVHIQECTEEWMKRERKTSREVVGEDDPLTLAWGRDFLILLRLAVAVGVLRDLAFLLQEGECLRGDRSEERRVGKECRL